jgi:hypothetical protein
VTQALKPLLDLCLMEEVTVFLLISWAEVDEVQSIAKAWPNLKLFRLAPCVQVPQAAKGVEAQIPSAIHCLSTLARECPNLTALQIYIN